MQDVTARRSGDGGDDGPGGGDDGDDDPDEVPRGGDGDGDDLPSPGRNFPGRFFLPERFSLSVVFRPVAAAEYFLDLLFRLRFFGTK